MTALGIWWLRQELLLLVVPAALVTDFERHYPSVCAQSAETLKAEKRRR